MFILHFLSTLITITCETFNIGSSKWLRSSRQFWFRISSFLLSTSQSTFPKFLALHRWRPTRRSPTRRRPSRCRRRSSRAQPWTCLKKITNFVKLSHLVAIKYPLQISKQPFRLKLLKLFYNQSIHFVW